MGGDMTQERIVFVHGSGSFGAAAWREQHVLAGTYDCLFVRRHGFDPVSLPLPTDFDADVQIVLEALGNGGHLVAQSQGAVSAMMAAVECPELVWSLTLSEPACLSLTSELPATRMHIELVSNLFARRGELDDEAFLTEFVALLYGVEATRPDTVLARRGAARLRLQAPPWEAPLGIVPGVPTMVLTGGWEPMFEEVAAFLGSTGAVHHQVGGGHKPLDTPEGMQYLREFLQHHGGKA